MNADLSHWIYCFDYLLATLGFSTTAVEPTKTRTTVVGDGETIGATAGAHGCTIRGSIMAVSEVVVTVGHESTMTVRSVELQRHSDGAMLAGMMTG